MAERLTSLWRQVADSLLNGKGSLSSEVRRAIYEDGAAVPAHLAALTRAVRVDSTSIGDHDLAAALAKGASEDELFEAILCAAFAAGNERLERGLALAGDGS